MTEPTAQDIENFAIRDAISAQFEAEYRQAAGWAHQIMDKGWLPVCRHFLLDKQDEQDCRRSGKRPTPVATCYTVTNGVSKRHFFLRDGKPTECSGYEEAFGPMLLEPHPTQGFTDQAGKFHHYHRFSLCWAGYELYTPRSAESLAAARERRQEKAVEKEALANPLFAEQIRAEGYQPPPRKHVMKER